MKFHAHIVDANGRVQELVLRADDADSARELLRAEGFFPKRIDEAAEDAAVTWTARTAVLERMAAARGASDSEISIPAGASRAATYLHNAGKTHAGELAVDRDATVYFVAHDDPAQSRRFTLAEVETATISGFPLRMLRVFMLNGDLIEFPAGFLFTGPVYKAAKDALLGKMPGKK